MGAALRVSGNQRLPTDAISQNKLGPIGASPSHFLFYRSVDSRSIYSVLRLCQRLQEVDRYDGRSMDQQKVLRIPADSATYHFGTGKGSAVQVGDTEARTQVLLEL